MSENISQYELNKQIASLQLKGLSSDEIIFLISQGNKEEHKIPVSIFQTVKLSSLEAIVSYLKDIKKLKFSEIAELLNRNRATIWTTYHRAQQKNACLCVVESKICIPVSIFEKRTFSVLELIVMYLKEMGIKNMHIALMLNKKESTISTVIYRYKKKLSGYIETSKLS